MIPRTLNALLSLVGLMRTLDRDTEIRAKEAGIRDLKEALRKAEEQRDKFRDQVRDTCARAELAEERALAFEKQTLNLADERDEALAGPWPKWAADLLTIIREYTGPCPEDGWEGVDLPEEMRVWLEGYRDEMQRTGNVKPVPQSEWEALKADALLWRKARDKRAHDRKDSKKGVSRG